MKEKYDENTRNVVIDILAKIAPQRAASLNYGGQCSSSRKKRRRPKSGGDYPVNDEAGKIFLLEDN